MPNAESESTKIQSRKWVATLWLKHATRCFKDLFKDLTDTGRVRCIEAGLETCPTTGEKHFQAYLVCYKPTRMSQVIRWFGKKHHFEPMYGTLAQNAAYCEKEGDYRIYGDYPKQGERHDLIGFKRKIDEGMQPEEIAGDEGHFGAFVKYSGGMAKYAHHVRGKKLRLDRTMPKVYIRIGDTRTGKTEWLDETWGRLGWARMPPPTSSWWLTPTGSYSDTVLFDDVGRTKIPKIEEALEYTDKYAVEFNSKGGNLWYKPKNVVFTSNQQIDKWWDRPDPGNFAAFMKRILRIDYLYKDASKNRVVWPNGVQQEREEEVVQQGQVQDEAMGEEEGSEEGSEDFEETDQECSDA